MFARTRQATIPTVHFPPFDADTVLKRTAFTCLNDALRKHGCCLLEGDAIPQDVVHRAFLASRKFFKLSAARKQRCCPAQRPLAQGYFAPQAEQVRGQPCDKENFDFYGPSNDELNSWPAEEQDFRDQCEKFHEDFLKVQKYLFEGLGDVWKGMVPEEVLTHVLKAHDGSNNLVSFNHYLSATAGEHQRAEQIRSPAHTDLSTLTLLLQDKVGGLQVADMDSMDKIKSKEVDQHAAYWDIDPNPNTLLLITGYYATLWQPLRCKGSVHRVMMPPLDENLERFSIAYFMTPSTKTTIKYQGDNGTKTLNVGEHIEKKRKAIHSAD